ncbi:peptidoglycan-binding domain-containing protein [Aquabacter sp. CN5-332]|uniref:peptidoglycan-binding domain-containing protein n=1 Tax=Aquabacter sp. CN5-332 TaxID=3156608 RepID=UPI0032B485D5
MSYELDARGASHLPEHDVLADVPGGRVVYRIADWFAAAVAVGVTGAVLVNIFMLQTGGVRVASQGATSVSVEPKARPASAPGQGNPAMIFAPPSAVGAAPAAAPAAPPPRAAAPAAPAPAPAQQNALLPPAPIPKVPSPLIADIQRELARRGLYDGAADGLTGPKTEAAIRAFEQSAHLRVTTGEPTEAVLTQLRRAPAPQAAAAPPMTLAVAPRTVPPPQAPVAAAPRASLAPPAAVPGTDSGVTGSVRPPGDIQGGSRLLAVQKSLARLGYGPIKMDGQPGNETRLAIQRFERDRNLPVTGEINDRMVRELAAVSGSAID